MNRLSNIWIVFKRYLLNCNLHGIRYIVEDDLHWTERLFWLITCALCWFGCAVMVQDSLMGFYNKPVEFTAESTYLDWETKFPSISVCLRIHPKSVDIAGSLYKKKHGSAITMPHAWNWLYGTQFSKGLDKTTAEMSQLTSEDVVHMYKESVLNCTSLLSECIWSASFKFNCCDEFMPLRTASGLCYVFNSIHTRNDTSLNKFTMNQQTGVGYLTIGITALTFYSGTQSGVLLYIDNNVAITSAEGNEDKRIDVYRGQLNTVYFTLEDTFNEPGIRHVSPSRRGCRFPDENDDFRAYRWYSNSGCLMELQMEMMLNVCQCVNHLFPYPPGTPVCNYTGRRCLKDYDIVKMASEKASRCLPDCEGTAIRHYQNLKTSGTKSPMFGVPQGIHLELLALPTTRYRRYVMRSLLDLVVAVGSTAGLFMGAGILSLVEIPYWLLLRHGS